MAARKRKLAEKASQLLTPNANQGKSKAKKPRKHLRLKKKQKKSQMKNAQQISTDQIESIEGPDTAPDCEIIEKVAPLIIINDDTDDYTTIEASQGPSEKTTAATFDFASTNGSDFTLENSEIDDIENSDSCSVSSDSTVEITGTYDELNEQIENPTQEEPNEQIKSPTQETPKDDIDNPSQEEPMDATENPTHEEPNDQTENPTQEEPNDQIENPTQEEPNEQIENSTQETPKDDNENPTQSFFVDRNPAQSFFVDNRPSTDFKTPIYSCDERTLNLVNPKKTGTNKKLIPKKNQNKVDAHIGENPDSGTGVPFAPNEIICIDDDCEIDSVPMTREETNEPRVLDHTKKAINNVNNGSISNSAEDDCIFVSETLTFDKTSPVSRKNRRSSRADKRAKKLMREAITRSNNAAVKKAAMQKKSKEIPKKLLKKLKKKARRVIVEDTTNEPSTSQADNNTLSKKNEKEEEEKLFNEKPELFEKRMIIIDGSNVARAFGRQDKTYSVKGIQICIEHFEKDGFNVKAVVPQMRMKKNLSTDPVTLEKLNVAGKVVLTPCKNLPGNRSSCYDDRFILEIAENFDGAIVSNDNYADLLKENPKWDKIINERVIGFSCIDDFIWIPPDPYGRDGKSLKMILHKRKTVANDSADSCVEKQLKITCYK